MVEVRLATIGDAEEIIGIYGPVILASATSFEISLPSCEEMQERIQACLQKYPWIICVIDGKLAGYVYGSKHRDREAYQWTCECSVYIHDAYKGKGIGKKLYRLLFRLLKIQQFRNVYAGITLPNEASILLHEKCGFEHFATYENVGYKFGDWHSVGWWKLEVNEYDPEPPPPLKLWELDPDMLTEEFAETARLIASRIY